MPFITRNKVIHTALAAPGAGKTESFIHHAPRLLSEGKCIVLALPTIKLTDSIVKRCTGIAFRVINSTTCQPVGPELASALMRKGDRFLITTHESIFQVEPRLLSGWTVVVDEIPQVLALPYYWFDPIELGCIHAVAYESEGQLFLRDEKKTEVMFALETHRAAAGGADRTSMLSKSGAIILQSLLLGRTVFIDSATDSGNRCIRPILELDCWSRFTAAEEVHVLGANVKGGLFDSFAQVHGFTFTRSMFTPDFAGYQCPITIYPLLPQGKKYSKSAVLTTLNGERTQKHDGGKPRQIIDALLNTALSKAGSKPLLFKNEWADFRWLPKGQATICTMDSRGLNDYMIATDAILLFGGNPSPAEQCGLDYLAKKYGRIFTDAFVTTRLLEVSLQAVTRTAIRVSGNTQPIRLFVQDERVANYLVSTYMPHALVDWSLSLEAPALEDRRTTEDPRKQKVHELLAQNKTNPEIVAITGIHRNTASAWKKDWLKSQAA